MPLAAEVDPQSITSGSIEAWQVLAALISVVVGWLLSRLTRKAVAGLLTRLEGVPENLRTVVSRTAGYLVLFLGIGIALSFLGAQIQPLIATVLIVGVIMALALRGIAENFAAGIVIQSRQVIHIGDEIEASGYVGVVKEVNSRSVVIDTWDGRTVHLPNAEVLANPLINNSEHGRRRTDIEVRMLSDDVERTVALVAGAVQNAPGVLEDPAPTVFVTAVDPDRVSLLVRFWHDPLDETQVASDVVAAVSTAGSGQGEDIAAIWPRPPAPTTQSPRV